MKLSLERFEAREPRRSRKALLISIAVHAVVILVLAQIVYHYDIGALIGLEPRAPMVPERIQYVRIAPTAAAGGGAGGSVGKPAKGRAPRLTAPSQVPTAVPEPATTPTTGAPDGTAEGKGTGGGSGTAAQGVTPAYTDSRLWPTPGPVVSQLKTPAQRVDSAIKAAFEVYLDSVEVAQAHQGRAPGDWTFGKDGEKWGVDPKWIHLGKVKIPTAVLAALPMNVSSNQTLNDKHIQSFVRQDILYQAQRAVSEDEFRDAVRRIRDRKDRERADRLAKEKERQEIARTQADGGAITP